MAGRKATAEPPIGRATGGALESLAEVAYSRIEDLIVRLELPPGRPVSEAEISARLGIGRTPVREALQRLAREGLVLVSPRRGIFVTEIALDAQLRLLEVRRSLERLLANRAARLAEPAQRARLSVIAAAMRRAGAGGDDAAFLDLDRQLNDLLASISRNEFAAAAMSLGASLSRRFWFRYQRMAGDLSLTCQLHADLADAVAGGDPGDATAAADRLLDYIERFTRDVFDLVI